MSDARETRHLEPVMAKIVLERILECCGLSIADLDRAQTRAATMMMIEWRHAQIELRPAEPEANAPNPES